MTLKKGKPVICYYLDGTEYMTFPSINKASRETRLNIASITLCCQRKKYKKVGNFIFKYKTH